MDGVGCLTPNMVSAGINYGLALPPHAADKPADHEMRNLSPISSMSTCLLNCCWRDEMTFCSISQACSIGFKSGVHAGRSMRTTVAFSRYQFVMLAVCAQTLSSIRMKSGPTVPAYVRTWMSKISLTYLTAVSVPFTLMCTFVFH